MMIVSHCSNNQNSGNTQRSHSSLSSESSLLLIEDQVVRCLVTEPDIKVPARIGARSCYLRDPLGIPGNLSEAAITRSK